jgi:opacity protein-like surface antigen
MNCIACAEHVPRAIDHLLLNAEDFTMKHRIIAASATLVTFACATGNANAQEAAQRSTIRGLSIGVHGSTTALTLVDNRSTSLGGGLGVSVGYGFGDRFAIHALTTGAFMTPSDQDDYILSHVDIEGRYTPGRRSTAWAPHVALGVTGRTGHFVVPETAGGGTTQRTTFGLTAGGGISYNLTPATSLGWSLRYTFGNIEERKCPDSADAVRTCATSTRANFGVSWHPFAR